MLLVMVSCKKDDTTSLQENKTEMANDPVVESIIRFNEQVKKYQDNPAVKSSETMTLEEAKDNIVNLFNAVYGEPMESYSELVTEEFSITIAVDNNGNVSANNAADAYLKMVEKARKGYKSSTLPNKGYKYIFVDEVEQTRGDSVTINLKGRFGTKGDNLGFHQSGPFVEGDDWHYVDGMGSCDGTRDGGADVLLRDMIKARYESELPENISDHKWVAVEILSESFSGSDLEYRDYLFYSEDVSQTCIDWQSMNYYLSWIYEIIYELIPEEHNFILKVNTDDTPTIIYDHDYFITGINVFGILSDETISYITHEVHVDYSEYVAISIEDIPNDEL